jgi:hypothetical protein
VSGLIAAELLHKRTSRRPGPHVVDRGLKGFHPLGPFGQFDQFLIRSGVLDHQFRLAVNGKHDRPARFLQLPKELRGIPLEIRE